MNLSRDKGYFEKCNEKLYVIELEEDNLNRLYSKYRELTGIISPKDIIIFNTISHQSLSEIIKDMENNIGMRR